MKGLSVNVMGSDCTNNGVTSGKKGVILVGPGIAEVFGTGPDHPALEIVVDFEPKGAARGYLMVARTEWLDALKHEFPDLELPDSSDHVAVRVRAEPIGSEGRRPMFGGHFIWSSDSRFPMNAPIPVFDRFE